MSPRLYDSSALALVAKEARKFRDEFAPILESLRLQHLAMTEQAAWRLLRRFVGPSCPSAAEDALTCVNLMGAEMLCTVHQDGSQVFTISRGVELLDSETVPPPWSHP